MSNPLCANYDTASKARIFSAAVLLMPWIGQRLLAYAAQMFGAVH